MKLDVKGALLSYLLILLLFFFFFFLYYALIMLYCVELKTRPETEALFYLFKDLFFLCFY